MLSDASVRYASKAHATKPLLHTLEEFHILLNSCLWTLVLFTSWKICSRDRQQVSVVWNVYENVLSKINSFICIHSYVVPKLYPVVVVFSEEHKISSWVLPICIQIKSSDLSDRITAGRGLLGSCRAGSGSPGEPGAHMWGRSGQCPGASPAREDDSC